MPELDVQIRSYFESIAPAFDTEALMAGTVRLEPVQPVRSIEPRRRRPWVVVAAAAIAVLIAGSVAVLLVAPRAGEVVDEPTPPSVTSSSSTTTPEESALPTVSGLTATPSPLGAIHWTRVDGDPASLPSGQVLAAPTGFAATNANGELIVSADGVEWSQGPSLPGGGEFLSEAGDRYVICVRCREADAAIWESRDLTSWGPVAIPEAVLDALPETAVDGSARPGQSVATSDVVLTEWSYFAEERSTTIYTISSEDTVRVIQPEWSAAAAPRGVVFLALNDMLYAYVRDAGPGEVGETEIWRSTDGLGWDRVGPAPWPDNVWIRGQLAQRDGIVLIGLYDGDQIYSLLRSRDGINFAPAADPPIPPGQLPAGSLETAETGFLWFADQPEGFALWVSTDGDTWQLVDTDELQIPDQPGGSGAGAYSQGIAGTTIYIVSYQETPPEATIWIGRIEG